MINISKFLTVGSLLLSGINAGSSNWDEYELGLELADVYDGQKQVALCNGPCMYAQDDYLRFFDDDCNVCLDDMTPCYSSKAEYGLELDEIYKGITQIMKWEHRITEEPQPIEVSEYGQYGEYGYIVDVKLDKEYIIGNCEYRTCETEQFEIINGKIKSYQVIKIHIKKKECMKTTSTPWEKSTSTTWETSTTHRPSAPFVPPPSSNPSWSPTTPLPTTPSPTTPRPTPHPTPMPTWPTPRPTPYPTTAWPTTAMPTTAEPTTAEPTTAEPTTAEPTTAEPTTAEPTTAEPTTAEPTAKPTTTANPTPNPTPSPTTADPTPSPTPFPTTQPTPQPTPDPVEPIRPNPSTKSPTMWKKSTAKPTPAPTTAKTCNYGEGVYTYSNGEQQYGPQCGLCDAGEKCVKAEVSHGYCSGVCVPSMEEVKY